MRFSNGIILGVVLMAGCAAPQAPTTTPAIVVPETLTPPVKTADELLDEGNPAEAAQQFLLYASAATANERAALWLKAAKAMFEAEQFEQSGALAKGVVATDLELNQQQDRRLLLAELALWARQPEEALSLLQRAPSADTDLQLLRRFYRARARAYGDAGNHFESARDYIALEPYLMEKDELQQNHEMILATLNILSENALVQLSPLAGDTLRGWIGLTLITKREAPNTREFKRQIRQWLDQNQAHPAADEFIASLLERMRELAINVEQIALLLPLSGKFAGPAASVRDGFLGAYYAAPANTRPRLKIYDTSGKADQIKQIYETAVSEGADFVVGPLSKEAVTGLAANGWLEVPVLALNYAQIDWQLPANFFQFSLSPENEAVQVAERAWLDGHSRAVAVVPKGSWGERILQAFARRWIELGGQLLEHQTYDAAKNDFSAPIQRMLNIDVSKRRSRNLGNRLGKKLKFEPRRRQDVEMVFMAAFPRQARLLRPQLRFHYAGDLAVYATSHAYSGHIDRSRDRDMNGIVFCDMPWVTPARQQPESTLKQQLAKIWPNKLRRFSRLFAMGVDAYNLTPYLDWLRDNPAQRYAGHTGRLFMSAGNRVQRFLDCQKLSRGRPRPAGYSPLTPLQPIPDLSPPPIPVDQILTDLNANQNDPGSAGQGF